MTEKPPRPGPGVVAGARPSRLSTLVALILAAFVVVELGVLGLGLVVTRLWDHSSWHRAELAFEDGIAAHRTPLWNQITRFGTALGSTNSVLVLTAVGCVVLALRGHGPRLPVFLALAVAGETVLFVLASTVLDRTRPPIPHLDGAPPTSSFPSGHTAASIALWGGLALGLARTHPHHRLRLASWVLAVAVPGFVLSTRLYRGMHWPTDVAASVLFTLAWLLTLRAILLAPGVPDEPRPGRRPG